MQYVARLLTSECKSNSRLTPDDSRFIYLLNLLRIHLLNNLTSWLIRRRQQTILRAPGIGEEDKLFDALMTVQAKMI